MMVDPATGRRFINEGLTRNALAQAVLLKRLQNGDKKPFIIYDEKISGVNSTTSTVSSAALTA